MDERCNVQDDEPLNDAVEQQNLPLEQPAVNRPNNQLLKPGAVPIGKLSILMAMVALLIALFIGILLGGGVPDEVIRNNTVLQAQIKQISLALKKQGNQINELADTINRVFNTTQATAVRVDDIYSNTDAKNTGNIKQLLRKTDEIEQMSLALEKQGNQINKLADTINHVFRTQNQSTLFTSLQSVSCKDIKATHLSSPTGYYYPNGRMVYCNMGELCGSGGGWTRLAYLDMSDSTESCPSGFKLYQSGGVRACGRTNGGCVSVTFPSNGISYSQVCGRVVGYEYGSADAVDSTIGTNQHNNINSYYVDGISITRGSSRKHVWTLIAGLHEASCPCSKGSTQNVQSFIGNDYFCESGNPATDGRFQEKLYVSDPLWDGEGCGSFEGKCCSAPGLPWFNKVLHAATTDYLELRVCGDEPSDNEDIPVSFYEIYVK